MPGSMQARTRSLFQPISAAAAPFAARRLFERHRQLPHRGTPRVPAVHDVVCGDYWRSGRLAVAGQAFEPAYACPAQPKAGGLV